MTAPIQEPSPYRTQAGHGWSIGQLARRPASGAPPQGPGGLGFAASVSLPVIELYYEYNNLEASATPTWAIDSNYAFNGYMQMNAQNAYVAWPVVLAPKGSTWQPYAVFGRGTDYGIVTCKIGNALPVDAGDDSDGLGGAGLFQDYGATTFVTLGTFDCYDGGGEAPFGGSPKAFPGFRIFGDDGVVGTAFSSPGTVFADYKWDGGAGPYFMEFSTPTKNASSGGYRMRISAAGFIRTDWYGLF